MATETGNPVRVGDVLVVGAGAAGLLIAHKLASEGLEVSLLEANGIGSEQSNHSHGYMHRGHIYAAPSPRLVAALNEGANWWRDTMKAAEYHPLGEAIATFTNPHTARTAAQKWNEAGLIFEPTSDTAVVGEGTHFRTEEATFNFTPWLLDMRTHLGSSGVHTIHGRADSLIRSDSEITGVLTRCGNRSVVLHARYYVLAAGTGNLPLVSTATRYRGRAINRLSFMMILRGSTLPQISLVSPENETYGLFVVSRTSPDSSTSWLVSNFLGFSDSSSIDAKWSYWARATLRTLRDRTSVFDSSDLEWAGYAAPKGELRTVRGSLDIHSIEHYSLTNLSVVSPSKLTLAPMLARDTVDDVLARIPDETHRGEDSADELYGELSVHEERWLTRPFFSKSSMARVIAGGHPPAGQIGDPQSNKSSRPGDS